MPGLSCSTQDLHSSFIAAHGIFSCGMKDLVHPTPLTVSRTWDLFLSDSTGQRGGDAPSVVCYVDCNFHLAGRLSPLLPLMMKVATPGGTHGQEPRAASCPQPVRNGSHPSYSLQETGSCQQHRSLGVTSSPIRPSDETPALADVLQSCQRSCP